MSVSFPNICIGILRHNVVALAGQAGQLIRSGDTAAIDRAAIKMDFTALGRFLITKRERDIAAFKTPGLRNVLVTAPYFSRRFARDALGCYGPLQQGRRATKSLP